MELSSVHEIRFSLPINLNRHILQHFEQFIEKNYGNWKKKTKKKLMPFSSQNVWTIESSVEFARVNMFVNCYDSTTVRFSHTRKGDFPFELLKMPSLNACLLLFRIGKDIESMPSIKRSKWNDQQCNRKEWDVCFEFWQIIDDFFLNSSLLNGTQTHKKAIFIFGWCVNYDRSHSYDKLYEIDYKKKWTKHFFKGQMLKAVRK